MQGVRGARSSAGASSERAEESGPILTSMTSHDEPWKCFNWGQMRSEIHSRRISGGETDPEGSCLRQEDPSLGTGHREDMGRDSVEGRTHYDFSKKSQFKLGLKHIRIGQGGQKLAEVVKGEG